jgi:hypothetical protein
METWETLTMSRKEVPRAGLLKAALAGKITNEQGARALRLSVRQFQRLKGRYRAEGARGLRHRLRGRASPRRLSDPVRARILHLLRTVYPDCNDCHATEKLREVEHLAVSRATVRRLRRAADLPAKRRRRPRRYRARRTPMAQAGALVQLDASPFAWFGPDRPPATLHGAIDDATGEPVALCFRPTEDLHGYLAVLGQLGRTHGVPLALYTDRLSVFRRNDAHWTLEEQLQGAQHPTHFGRILDDLAIGLIQAHSPQAKGRVERLWGTLQDRLVVELRLHGLTTLAAANAFLPTFLADFCPRFARPPADLQPAWRLAPRDLPDVLSCRYVRTVGHDNTVRLGSRLLQLRPGPGGRSWTGCHVEVRECLDGRALVVYQQRRLLTVPAPAADFVLSPRSSPHRDRARPRRARSAALRRALADLAQATATASAAPEPPPPLTRPTGEGQRGAPRPLTSRGRYLPLASHARHSPRRPPVARRAPAPTHPWRRSFFTRGRAPQTTPRG